MKKYWNRFVQYMCQHYRLSQTSNCLTTIIFFVASREFLVHNSDLAFISSALCHKSSVSPGVVWTLDEVDLQSADHECIRQSVLDNDRTQNYPANRNCLLFGLKSAQCPAPGMIPQLCDSPGADFGWICVQLMQGYVRMFVCGPVHQSPLSDMRFHLPNRVRDCYT